jgi:hypothetical protein
MRRPFVIYTLHLIPLNFLINEDNFIFCFFGVAGHKRLTLFKFVSICASCTNILLENCQFHQSARKFKQAASITYFADFLDVGSTNILVQDS